MFKLLSNEMHTLFVCKAKLHNKVSSAVNNMVSRGHASIGDMSSMTVSQTSSSECAVKIGCSRRRKMSLLSEEHPVCVVHLISEMPGE